MDVSDVFRIVLRKDSHPKDGYGVLRFTEDEYHSIVSDLQARIPPRLIMHGEAPDGTYGPLIKGYVIAIQN